MLSIYRSKNPTHHTRVAKAPVAAAADDVCTYTYYNNNNNFITKSVVLLYYYSRVAATFTRVYVHKYGTFVIVISRKGLFLLLSSSLLLYLYGYSYHYNNIILQCSALEPLHPRTRVPQTKYLSSNRASTTRQ
jgi:hypothetical protein